MPKKQKSESKDGNEIPAAKSKVVVIKPRSVGEEPQERSRRFIVQIGPRRVAFDFTSRMTELPPPGKPPARVLPVDKRRRSSPAQGDQPA